MQKISNITILPAFGDNYIYLAESAPERCFVIDPGQAHVVLETLKQRHLALTHILLTHHHTDHIGGVDKIKNETGCTVIGPDPKRIRTQDTTIADGDILELEDTTVRCIATPGHTATSVCFLVTGKAFTPPVLFTGDTLFVCGCGRMFECDGQTMFASLQKLAALADETLIYPGHDYTEENLEFALTLNPDNDDLQQKHAEIKGETARSEPTVPSTLAEEKKLNPFLAAADWQTFTDLRRKKDVF